MKKALSVTLDTQNVTWLRGQAGATTRGSLSEVLDDLVREARLAGRTRPEATRSVVGTVDLAADDPTLAGADAYIRELFHRSAQRPALVKDPRAPYGGPPPRVGRTRFGEASGQKVRKPKGVRRG